MISKLLYLNFGKCGHDQHSLTLWQTNDKSQL